MKEWTAPLAVSAPDALVAVTRMCGLLCMRSTRVSQGGPGIDQTPTRPTRHPAAVRWAATRQRAEQNRASTTRLRC
jgi:hypothetical protein